MKSSAPSATTSGSIYFTAQNEAALILSSNPYPDKKSIKITREALSTLRWFMQYAFNATRSEGLSFRTQPDKAVKVPYDILMNIFYFLHADIAQLLTKQRTAPVKPPSEQQELEHLALSLRLTSSKITQPNLFFFDYKLGHLSNASLNADFKTVQRIVEKTNPKNPENLRILLSTETTAIIIHLGIERTGTPLQMALYSHDETMFKLLADQMDPAEVQRQCKVIFDRYKVADYNELIKKLEADANRLCGELEAAFTQASTTDITNALNRVPGTTSVLQDALNRFNINLDRYVRDNSVHNPYILQRLFEIYDQLPYDWNTECLISQQAIGLAQKLSSAQWLQHYAQGIYYLGKSDVEPARREFSCRSSSPVLDIRSSSVLSLLGVDSCIDIFGNRRRGGRRVRVARLWPFRLSQTFVEQKQRAWKTYAANDLTSSLRLRDDVR